MTTTRRHRLGRGSAASALAPALAAGALALALAAPARAGDDAGGDAYAALNRLVEADRRGAWREAIDAWRRLDGVAHGLAQRDRELGLLARAHWALGERARAEAAWEEVLARAPDHVVALERLAAATAARGDRDRARELLVLAARAGRLVLRDAAAAGSEHAWLLDEPGTVLRLMDAARAAEPAKGALHDPFLPPPALGPCGHDACAGPRCEVDRGDETANPPRPHDPTLAELDRLLDELAAAVRGGEQPMPITRLARIRALLREAGRLGDPAVAARLDALRARHAELEAVARGLALQLLADEVNVHLRAAARAVAADEHEAALAACAAARDVARRLAAEGDPAFARAAEAVDLRLAALERRARTLQRVAGLALEVTGVTLDGADPARARAIVNDRVVGPGDAAPSAGDGEPLRDVTVIRVAAGAVTFRVDDLEVVRALRARPTR